MSKETTYFPSKIDFVLAGACIALSISGGSLKAPVEGKETPISTPNSQNVDSSIIVTDPAFWPVLKPFPDRKLLS